MSSEDLFHGGDRPRRPMEERLDALFRTRGDVPPRWVPRRLILQNYWLYPYQEFHFGNGRLMLRGPNGSGKTSVLVSAVTLVLDGEKSRSRLDPFRQAGRSIAYYLVGKKDAEEGGFHHEDRTGYVALELQHGDDGRFLTVGVGMRGRRLSGGGAPRVESWGFVLRDGRRVGRDRDLELVTGAGVPLTRAELAERIGGGGVVVERVSDYQVEVNRGLFGFADEADFRFLVQILLSLRSPKLNKELKPSDVAEILSDSLPPLDPTLLERVTQVMDDIDATRADIEATRQNHAWVERVHQAVARFANQVAQEWALDYRECHEALEEVQATLVDAREAAASARREQEDARARLEEADRERADLRGRLEVLRNHEAYRSQEALGEARKELARTRAHHEGVQQAVEDARGAVVASEKERSRLRTRWAGHRKAAAAEAERLAEAAERAAWPHAEQRATEVARGLEALVLGPGDAPEAPEMRAEALARLAAEREERLEEVLEALQGVARARAAQERADSGVEEAGRALRHGHDELRTAREEVEDGRAALTVHVEAWHRDLRELEVAAPVVAEVGRDLHRIDEPDAVSAALLEPFLRLAACRRAGLDQDREERRNRAGAVEIRRSEIRTELEVWEGRDEAEPEPRSGQPEARASLAAAGLPAEPLYRAVEPRGILSEERVRRLDAGLRESGLLDALVVRGEDEAEVLRRLGGEAGDRWIRPRPLPEGTPTLADVLEPVPSGLPAEAVTAALRSVALREGDGSEPALVDPVAPGRDDAAAPAAVPAAAPAFVDADGRWTLGPLRGRGPEPAADAPVYLGRRARVRERDRQVARLRSALEAMEEERRTLQEEMRVLAERLRRLDAELDELREMPEAAALAAALTVRAERSRQVDRLNGALKEAERRATAARRAVGDARQVHEEALRGIPEARGRDAEGVRVMIVAGEQVVTVARAVDGRLELLRDQAQELQRLETAMARQRVALDNARAREREASEAVAEAGARVELVGTRLQELGFDEIARQVRIAEERSEALEGEGRTLAGTIDRLDERLANLRERLEGLEGERARREEARTQAREGLARAVRAYPTLAEAAALLEEGSEGAAGRTADHLLQRREDRPTDLRRRIEDDRARAWQALTQEVTESRSALIDHHPSLDLDGNVSFRHEGRELPPHALLEVLERHRRQQMSVMREKEDELYEEFFLQEVSGRIRESIERAEESVQRVNALLSERPLANDEILWLRWRPFREVGVEAADHPRLVELLRKPASVLPPEDVRWIKAFFRDRVRMVREDAARTGGPEPGASFAEALQAVLDYRRWFRFTIHGRRPDEPATEISDREFASRSGGEKALAMFVPLLAAVDARFQGARPEAPKLVGLDEAFAGVDSDNINEMFAFMVSLDLSWIMTSEKLWGVGASLPSSTTYQFHRKGTVAAVRLWLWDGRRNVDETSLTVSGGDEPAGEEVGAA